MTEVEEVKPYSRGEHKAEQVEKMFDAIAPSYDLMNGLMTFGLHRVWRNKALRRLRRLTGTAACFGRGAEKEGRPTSRGARQRILDVACGTGDVTFRLASMYPEAQILGIDLSDGMLARAHKRLDSHKHRHQSDRIVFAAADCLNLPYEDESFDAVTVAYGVRNFERLDVGFREMLRVLRPGGSICVIELCEPTNPLMRAVYKAYTRCVFPLVGRIVSGDSRAYSYLLQSIGACPQRGGMTRLMREAGFADTAYTVLFPHTVAIYTGRRQD